MARVGDCDVGVGAGSQPEGGPVSGELWSDRSALVEYIPGREVMGLGGKGLLGIGEL